MVAQVSRRKLGRCNLLAIFATTIANGTHIEPRANSLLVAVDFDDAGTAQTSEMTAT